MSVVGPTVKEWAAADADDAPIIELLGESEEDVPSSEPILGGSAGVPKSALVFLKQDPRDGFQRQVAANPPGKTPMKLGRTAAHAAHGPARGRAARGSKAKAAKRWAKAQPVGNHEDD